MNFLKNFSRDMRPPRKRGLAAALFGFSLVSFTARVGFAQQIPAGHATDFTSASYFEPPNEQRMRMRLSGAEALPLPGGLLDVRRLKVETFALDGKTEVVIHAPQCTYAPLDGTANSPGHLDLETGDGRLHLTGEGFLWQQTESHLIISNQVKTVITPAAGAGGLL